MNALVQADFRIVGEDDAFLAVDKPAGLLVHPTRPGGPPTLWDGLRGLLGYELANGGQVSIVNRLDRETSGIVVIAKTREAAREAGLAMEARKVRKAYVAAVFGWPSYQEWAVEVPIIRRGEVGPAAVHLERCVHPDGAPALTRFRLVGTGGSPRGRFAIVAAEPHTGRTHQIRVHLAYSGHPVIGDKLYAKGSAHYLDFVANGWTARLEDALWLPRHALHCGSMEIAGRCWTAPLPPDMEAFQLAV